MVAQQRRVYRIVVAGELDESWAGWLEGFDLHLQTTPQGERRTTLTGAVADQAALRGVLTRIWDMNLALIALERMGDDGG